MREDDSDILEYSIIKYQPASFLGLNGYKKRTLGRFSAARLFGG
jgi:hypothetical protein